VNDRRDQNLFLLVGLILLVLLVSCQAEAPGPDEALCPCPHFPEIMVPCHEGFDDCPDGSGGDPCTCPDGTVIDCDLFHCPCPVCPTCPEGPTFEQGPQGSQESDQ